MNITQPRIASAQYLRIEIKAEATYKTLETVDIIVSRGAELSRRIGAIMEYAKITHGQPVVALVKNAAGSIVDAVHP